MQLCDFAMTELRVLFRLVMSKRHVIRVGQLFVPERLFLNRDFMLDEFNCSSYKSSHDHDLVKTPKFVLVILQLP